VGSASSVFHHWGMIFLSVFRHRLTQSLLFGSLSFFSLVVRFWSRHFLL
jgi:hypothetical protein